MSTSSGFSGILRTTSEPGRGDITRILDTDASNHAIGAELLQVHNGVERLIGFGSFVYDSVQRNYCTTRKELLAVVRFTRHFKHNNNNNTQYLYSAL